MFNDQTVKDGHGLGIISKPWRSITGSVCDSNCQREDISWLGAVYFPKMDGET